MPTDQDKKFDDRQLRKKFALKEAGFKCEGCGSRGDHGKRLYLYHINGNRKNLSKKNTAILCSECRDWYQERFRPGQAFLFTGDKPEWLLKRGH